MLNVGKESPANSGPVFPIIFRGVFDHKPEPHSQPSAFQLSYCCR